MTIRRNAAISAMTALLALTFVSVPSATAISDGQSPATCGNPSTARSVVARDYFNNVAGWIDLRYSSACPGSPTRATWARSTNSNSVTCVPGDVGCGDATVVRGGTSVSTCYFASGATSCYSGAARDLSSGSNTTTAYATGHAEGTTLGASGTTGSYSY